MPPFPAFVPTPSRFALRMINALLAREAWARERLARHAGKTLRLVLGGFSLVLTIDTEGRVEQADAAVVPDVTLSVQPDKLNLAGMLPGAVQPFDAAAFTHIAGDAALAQVVADLARDLRFDIEDDLAHRVGDIAALRLIEGGRGFMHGMREAGIRLARNMTEYLAQERAVLTGRPALEQWRLDLAELNHETDQLARSISALAARLARRGA